MNVYSKEDEADAVLAHRRRHFNSPAVVTRRSASVIKVNGQTYNNGSKRRLAFSFTVIISTSYCC